MRSLASKWYTITTMELFAHHGVEHATEAEAVGHIISTNVVTIMIIIGAVLCVSLSMQWLLRKTSKASIKINNRER